MLIEQRLTTPEQEGSLPADRLRTLTTTLAFTCLPSLLAHLAHFGLAAFIKPASQFLQINQSISLSLYVYTHTRHILLVLYPWESLCCVLFLSHLSSLLWASPVQSVSPVVAGADAKS